MGWPKCVEPGISGSQFSPGSVPNASSPMTRIDFWPGVHSVIPAIGLSGQARSVTCNMSLIHFNALLSSVMEDSSHG